MSLVALFDLFFELIELGSADVLHEFFFFVHFNLIMQNIIN